jgi:hypothetical protein
MRPPPVFGWSELADADYLAPALGFEEGAPRGDLGMLTQESSPLALCHPTPHPELDMVVECIGTTFKLYRAVPTNGCRLALRSAPDEQLVRIDLAATCPGHPGQSCFVLYGRSCRFRHVHPLSEAY